VLLPLRASDAGRRVGGIGRRPDAYSTFDSDSDSDRDAGDDTVAQGVARPVWYYATTASAPHAQVVTVTHGSLVVFLNDDSTGYFPGPHTAGGFGSSGFPSSFGASGNANQFNSNGSTIEGNQWSTGSLNGGQMSQVFTVGPPGAYWFGCGYHYTTVPTASNASMGDVLVSI